MKKITKAIFPVAGFGTRFLPATKAQPKEMLPIVDKPVIQYLVEEAVKAGIEEITFVTGRGKRAIEDHFDYSFELEKTLVEKNKLDLLKKVKAIDALAKFSYVRQPIPKGDGHAVNCAAHLFNDDESVLIMFGDTLYDAEISPVTQVMDVYEKYGATVIGLAERYRGANAGRGSGFQNAMMNAGAGLSENLASLKGNLINQMLGQQTQAANVGLGYAQLPGQRYAQQMNAAQTALPASMIPQQQQQEMDRYAQNREFQQKGAVLGQLPWGQMGIPARKGSPTFWQGALPRIGGAIQGGLMGAVTGGPWGAAAGAAAGAMGAQPPAIQVGNMGGGAPQRLMGPVTNNM